jgi:hypothetical protein
MLNSLRSSMQSRHVGISRQESIRTIGSSQERRAVKEAKAGNLEEKSHKKFLWSRRKAE